MPCVEFAVAGWVICSCFGCYCKMPHLGIKLNMLQFACHRFLKLSDVFICHGLI